MPSAERGAMLALAEQLPEVNRLLESNFEEISGTFLCIAAGLDGYRQLSERLDGPDELKAELKTQADQLKADIQRVIASLQFQDRVSQNLVITTNVLQMLSCDQADTSSERTRELVELMKLGDIRQPYIHYLIEHDLIAPDSDIAQMASQSNPTASEEDDIELF